MVTENSAIVAPSMKSVPVVAPRMPDGKSMVSGATENKLCAGLFCIKIFVVASFMQLSMSFLDTLVTSGPRPMLRPVAILPQNGLIILDRNSVGQGKSGTVRVGLGGSRRLKRKKKKYK